MADDADAAMVAPDQSVDPPLDQFCTEIGVDISKVQKRATTVDDVRQIVMAYGYDLDKVETKFELKTAEAAKLVNYFKPKTAHQPTVSTCTCGVQFQSDTALQEHYKNCRQQSAITVSGVDLDSDAADSASDLDISVDEDLLVEYPKCPMSGYRCRMDNDGFMKYAVNFDGAHWVEREMHFLALLGTCKHVVSLLWYARNPFGGYDFGMEALLPLAGSSVGRLQVAYDLLNGLSECHEHGVVHADIKPDHVMWSPQDRVCKLIDFGGALFVDTHSKDYKKPGGVVGTRGFISPEVEAGCVPSTHSDVWSAGVSLLHIFFPHSFRRGMSARDTLRTISDLTQGPWVRFLALLVVEEPTQRLTPERAIKYLRQHLSDVQ